jgi:hypothetical protein
MRQCLLGTAETHRELATCDQQQRLTATDVDSRSADLLAAVSTTSTALHSNPEITQGLLVETSYAGIARLWAAAPTDPHRAETAHFAAPLGTEP